LSDMADAIRFFYSGNLEVAESILEDIIKEDRYNVSALVRYGAVLEGLEKIKEAGEVYRQLAWLYYREESYLECLEVLAKAMEYLPQAGGLQELMGNSLYHLGRYEEALPYFEESSKNLDTLFISGKTHFALKKYEGALQEFMAAKRKGIRKEDRFLADYWTGKSLFALGKYDEALTFFELYREAYIEEAQIYLDLALCHMERGRTEEAEELLLHYQEIGGDINQAKLNLGLISYRRGDLEKAAEHLEEAADNPTVLHWRGLAYYGLGLYEKAIDCFTEVQKTSDDPFYMKIIGSSHLKEGNYFEAKMVFEKAIAENTEPDEELDELLAVTLHCLELM